MWNYNSPFTVLLAFTFYEFVENEFVENEFVENEFVENENNKLMRREENIG